MDITNIYMLIFYISLTRYAECADFLLKFRKCQCSVRRKEIYIVFYGFMLYLF